MGKVLCATRGGPDSQRTQQAAIDMAREQGDDLVFLYVADASFLNTIAAAVVVDIVSELDRMGRFQLAMAQEQAAEQGMAAGVAIRHGRLQDQLIAAVQELGATAVVLGRPRGEDSIFDETALQAFAHRVKDKTGATVLIA